MKVCFKCNLSKPLSEFYKHSKMADGHLNKCKICTRTDVKTHRRNNDSVREYDRKRGNRQSHEYLKNYRKDNPVKYKAHNAVTNALRDGKLVKQSKCEDCLSDFHVEAHHDDYSLPLKIRWLCARCHSLWHEQHGEGLNG
jgi:hypothetical protein